MNLTKQYKKDMEHDIRNYPQIGEWINRYKNIYVKAEYLAIL